MSEPIPGSARVTEIDMTTTFMEQYATHLLDNGTLRVDEPEAFMAELARVAEMNTTGFDTEAWFDHAELMPRVDKLAGAFTIASLGKTGETYLVVITKRVDDAYQAMVQIYTPGWISETFYQMTLTRADNGTVRMNARW